MLNVEIATIAFDPSTRQPVLLLKPAGEPDPAKRLVPISLGYEAFAIISALQGAELPRPQTHDLMSNIMTTLQADIQRVDIHAFDEHDGTFYASLTFTQHGVSFVVDARPSDAIALALRRGAPLFIDETVFQKTAVQTNVVTVRAPLPFAAQMQTVANPAQALSAIHNFAENVQPCDFD